jgi:hypothetical protein
VRQLILRMGCELARLILRLSSAGPAEDHTILPAEPVL